jgi:hypothetical protein
MIDLRWLRPRKLQDALLSAATDGRLNAYSHEIRDLTTYQAVLVAAQAFGPSRHEFTSLFQAAIGVSRSVSTARLCPVAAARLTRRKPYELCALLARIAEECPTRSTSEVDA